MILSFFVFLVISLSMFFGLTSYIIGFRNELPNEVFSSQKYYSGYDTWRLGNSNGQINYADSSYTVWDSEPSVLSDDALNAVYKEISNLTQNDNLGLTTNELKQFANSVVNLDGGVLQEWRTFSVDDFLKHINKVQDKESFTESLDKLIDKVLDKWQSTNIVSYALNGNFFTKYDEYKNKVSFGLRSPVEDDVSATYRIKRYVFPKGNKYLSKIYDNGVYETKKYKDMDNVFFVSPSLEKTKQYKLGQKYDLPFTSYNSDKVFMNSFIYGGISTYVSTMNVVNHPTDHYYYIGNYNPDTQPLGNNLLKQCYALSNENVLFNNATGSLSKKEIISYWQKQSSESAHPWIRKNNDLGLSWFVIKQEWWNANLIYTAMFSLSIVFDVIMLLLDVIIAWFLIKEIIRSLSKELLFLKTLGMTNNEVSLITSTTLLIILGVALGCGLAGMLGIQALFINLTSNFVDDLCNWSTIQPYSLIAIFGSIIFLFVTYYAASALVIRNMNLASTNVTSKSEFRFKKLANFLFTKNINSGITFSFTVKNLNKIIVTFLIMFLISMLSFIALGFQNSISENTTQQKNILLNKDNLSWVDQQNYIYERYDAKPNEGLYYADANNGTVPVVDFVNKGITKNNHFDIEGKNPIDILSSPVKGQFIYRSDLEKILNEMVKHPNPVINQLIGSDVADIKKSFDKLCTKYDDEIDALWPGSDKNFTINFGSLFYEGTYGVSTFQLNDYYAKDRYQNDRLIVLDKNDQRYKRVFKNINESFSWDQNNNDAPILPVVVSSKNLHNRNLDEGDYSEDSTNVDFHIDGYFNQYAKMKLHYRTSDNGLNYVENVYVKKDDFVKWLDYANKVDDANEKEFTNDLFYKDLIRQLNEGTFKNSFMDNGIPIGLKQMVIPSGYTDYASKNPNEWNYTNITTFGQFMKQFITSNSLSNNGINLYTVWRDNNNKVINPLVTTMLVVLVLSIVLVISFIIFMIMTIMSENDQIIFIMKALGYGHAEILWRIVSGYLLSIVFSIVLGIGIAAVILKLLSPTFFELLFLHLGVFASGPILGLFFGLIVAMGLFVLGISSYKISKRNLTVREE